MRGNEPGMRDIPACAIAGGHSAQMFAERDKEPAAEGSVQLYGKYRAQAWRGWSVNCCTIGSVAHGERSSATQCLFSA
jgi:hypothetical protein